MNISSHLRSKYLALAQTLGDIEFQIYILSARRDEIRATIKALDESVPDLKKLEDEYKKIGVQNGEKNHTLQVQNGSSKKAEGK